MKQLKELQKTAREETEAADQSYDAIVAEILDEQRKQMNMLCYNSVDPYSDHWFSDGTPPDCQAHIPGEEPPRAMRDIASASPLFKKATAPRHTTASYSVSSVLSFYGITRE